MSNSPKSNEKTKTPTFFESLNTLVESFTSRIYGKSDSTPTKSASASKILKSENEEKHRQNSANQDRIKHLVDAHGLKANFVALEDIALHEPLEFIEGQKKGFELFVQAIRRSLAAMDVIGHASDYLAPPAPVQTPQVKNTDSRKSIDRR